LLEHVQHQPQRCSQSRHARLKPSGYQPILIPLLEAFATIGVGHTKGYQMVKAGLLETVMIGKRRYVPRTELERLATP
jgi:hypothetical protein